MKIPERTFYRYKSQIWKDEEPKREQERQDHIRAGQSTTTSANNEQHDNNTDKSRISDFSNPIKRSFFNPQVDHMA